MVTVPGVLPDWADSLATSRMSSDSCQATPIAAQAGVTLAVTLSGAPENIAPNCPDVAIRDPVFSVATPM